jgi:hypothetical protein
MSFSKHGQSENANINDKPNQRFLNMNTKPGKTQILTVWFASLMPSKTSPEFSVMSKTNSVMNLSINSLETESRHFFLNL